MFSLSNALFLFAACRLVASAPIPSVVIPGPDDPAIGTLQDFKRRADDAGLVLPPDFKPLATSSKEFLRFDSSDFKRRADDAGLVLPPDFKPPVEQSKELLRFDSSDFKRRADDAGLVLPPDFKPLATSSKEFLRFDSSDFKRQADDAGLVLPPDFKPPVEQSKELLRFDSSDFKRRALDPSKLSAPAEGSAFVSEQAFGSDDIFKRQDLQLDLPPDAQPLKTFGGSKELVNFDSTDF